MINKVHWHVELNARKERAIHGQVLLIKTETLNSKLMVKFTLSRTIVTLQNTAWFGGSFPLLRKQTEPHGLEHRSVCNEQRWEAKTTVQYRARVHPVKNYILQPLAVARK